MVFGARALGKDKVAGSNPAISSMNLEHVVTMGPGFFLLPGQLRIVTQASGERQRKQEAFRGEIQTILTQKEAGKIETSPCLFIAERSSHRT